MTGAGALLVLCGDWAGVDACGVAHSERALLAGGPTDTDVVDPADLGAAVTALRRARRAGSVVLLVYPTRSTVARVRPLLAFLLAAVLIRGDRLRLHLHEYRIFREVRWALGLVLLVGRPTVVVSSAGEQRRLARSLAARLRRVRPLVIPPFGPLTPERTGADARHAAGSGVVGVFGFAGPAKGTDLVTSVLRSLPASYHRIDLVGRGWSEVVWPPDITDRFEVVARGFVPSAELGAVFAGWELAVAPFSTGASDGRSSLRIPLSHGIPTITTAGDADDLTLRAAHLVVVLADDVASVTARATALAADPDARRQGATDLARFEARVATDLRAALLGDLHPVELAGAVDGDH